MELDFAALLEDAASARAQLYKSHCLHADDQMNAALALATVLLQQAQEVLEAVYGNDKQRAKEHIHVLYAPHSD